MIHSEEESSKTETHRAASFKKEQRTKGAREQKLLERDHRHQPLRTHTQTHTPKKRYTKMKAVRPSFQFFKSYEREKRFAVSVIIMWEARNGNA